MIKSDQLNLQKLGPLGAEIIGLDLSEPLDKTLLESIKHKLLEHLVLVFRNQYIVCGTRDTLPISSSLQC